MSDNIEFGRPSQAPKRSHVGSFVTVICLALIMGGAGAAWVNRDKWLPGDEDAQIPLIKAQTTPLKVRPSEPGGMTVPNQDKLIYDRMQGGALPPEVERLLPEPEAPIAPPRPALPVPGSASSAATQPPPPATPARPVTSAPILAPTEPPREVARATAPEAPPAPPPPPAVVPVPLPRPGPGPDSIPAPDAPQMEALTPPAPPQPPPAAAPKAPSPPATTASTGGAGGYRIQLVSVRSEDVAKQEWTRLRSRNADLLGKLDQSVSRADLGGDRGVYYRLRAGPLADEAAAKQLCTELAKRNVGCLVVRPGS
jgi:outer membrane biosynthesis protein TonB